MESFFSTNFDHVLFVATMILLNYVLQNTNKIASLGLY